jgi:hypothetical protein
LYENKTAGCGITSPTKINPTAVSSTLTPTAINTTLTPTPTKTLITTAVSPTPIEANKILTPTPESPTGALPCLQGFVFLTVLQMLILARNIFSGKGI